jgi:2-oxo-4-hydroxy-4-carboxy-5-ureidoimidazoline decarboxylase
MTMPTNLPTSYDLETLNQMEQNDFTNALGAIFEEHPTIAAQAWFARPFGDRDALHQAMANVVHQMTPAAQIKLICAHPDLGSKFKMAEASVQEQSTLGLDRLSAAEFAEFQQLNQAYKDKFAFPFIIAIRNHTKESVLEAFHQRLHNSIETEKQRAIAEILEIARWRLVLTVI